MTKKISLFIFSAFLSIGVFAQEGAKVGFRISPMISWGNITNDSTKTKPDGLNTGSAMGFSFDFMFTYGFSENFALRTGINISTKGIKSSVDLSPTINGKSSLDSKLGVTAVEVPIGFKFRSPEIGTGLFVVGFFGVNAELNVQNKLVQDQLSVTLDSLGVPTITLDEDVESRDVDGINFFTTSFVPGAGVDWEFDWGMLQFALNYHWGLLSYTNHKKTDFDGTPNQFYQQVTKMNAISLSVGYFF